MARRIAERDPNYRQRVISPPLRGDLYGLDYSWHGHKWLESVEGDDANVVWLGHSSLDGKIGVLVGTAKRSGLEDWFRAPEGFHGLETAALVGLDRLARIVSPGERVQVPPGLSAAEVSLFLTTARRCREWQTLQSQVGDEPIELLVWDFAGARVGLSSSSASSCLVIVGVGDSLDRLPYVNRADGASYGVSFARHLTLGDIHRSVGRMPSPNDGALHSDQLMLIDKTP